MRVIYLALAGGSVNHDDHKISQISTWAQNLDSNARIIWMHGDPALEAPKIIGNDLYIPIDEKYENLLAKTLVAIRWVIENLDFDFLIRTNTSNYFYHALVEKHLSNYNSNSPIVAGVIASWRGKIRGARNRYLYISGAGIYMSNYSAKILSRMNSDEYEGIPDDVAIGYWLKINKIRFYSIPRNNISDFKPIWPTPQTRVKSWNKPKLTCERMHNVHAIYTSRNSESLHENIDKFRRNEISTTEKSKKVNQILFNFQYQLLTRLINLKFKKLFKDA